MCKFTYALAHPFIHHLLDFSTWITHSGTIDTKMNETEPLPAMASQSEELKSHTFVRNVLNTGEGNAGIKPGVREHGPKGSQSCLGESGKALRSIYGRTAGATGGGHRRAARGGFGQIGKSIGCRVWLPSYKRWWEGIGFT